MANRHATKKHAKSSWVSKGKDGRDSEKPWGKETQWSCFDGIHGKTLFIRKGMRTSLKYHRLKAEVLFLRTGEASITHGSEHTIEDPVGFPMQTSTMHAGDTLMVQSGCPYRIEALSDCEIVEVGNHSADKPIRIEDDFGRVNKELESK